MQLPKRHFQAAGMIVLALFSVAMNAFADPGFLAPDDERVGQIARRSSKSVVLVATLS